MSLRSVQYTVRNIFFRQVKLISGHTFDSTWHLEAQHSIYEEVDMIWIWIPGYDGKKQRFFPFLNKQKQSIYIKAFGKWN